MLCLFMFMLLTAHYSHIGLFRDPLSRGPLKHMITHNCEHIQC